MARASCSPGGGAASREALGLQGTAVPFAASHVGVLHSATTLRGEMVALNSEGCRLLDRALRGLEVPVSARRVDQGNSIRMDLTNTQLGHSWAHLHDKDRCTAVELIALLCKALQRVRRSIRWSSMQINKDDSAEPHTDTDNQGPCIFGLCGRAECREVPFADCLDLLMSAIVACEFSCIM